LVCDNTGTVRNVASATNASVPLAADNEVGEDLHRRVVVEEGVDAVAHRVLHREELPDATNRLRVVAHPVTKPQQASVQLGLERTQSLVGVGGAGVEVVAAGQHEQQRVERGVGVLRCAAGHSTGVVGDHPADGAGHLARRVRAELASVGSEPGVDRAHRHTGLHRHPRSVVQHPHRAKMPADVDQDACGRALAAEAGASRPEGEWDPLRRTDFEQAPYVGSPCR
jgi:hypothetical protein